MKTFPRIPLRNFTIFFVYANYSYPDFHFSQICEFERTDVSLFLLFVVLSHSPTSLFRIPFFPTAELSPPFIPKNPVPSFSFLLRSELRWLRCVVMNHNFKLKLSETSVTNDAELLNYALKSARENV